ncbi:MAG: response regulator [Phycisphaerae bacterium]|nr:response regulator [Phycisphaerae bacterium]
MGFELDRAFGLRRDHETVDRFLDSLDRASHETRLYDERQSERLAYRIPAIEAEFLTYGGCRTRYLLPTRNISRDGVSLLAGTYFYSGTSCRLHLVCTHHGVYPTTGRVVRCRYITGSGTLHEVGIRFDHPLDVTLFDSNPRHTRVLLMSRNAALPDEVAAAFPTNRLQLHCADNSETTLEMMAKNRPDAIILDMQAPDAWAAVHELREREYRGILVALTSTNRPEAQQRYLGAGCDRCIATPIDHEQLRTALGLMTDEPIRSRLAGDPTMAQPISEFVTSLANQISELGYALQASNIASFGSVVSKLKRQATGCGFDVIAEVATRLEAGLLGGVALDKLQDQLTELARRCSAAEDPLGRDT